MQSSIRDWLRWGARAAGFALALNAGAATAAAQCSERTQSHLAAPNGTATISACEQTKQGDILIADGQAEVDYQDQQLRADHIEYDLQTHDATATGHVQLDYRNQHLDASDAKFNIETKRGVFHHVHGEVKIERKPNPAVLITDNPLSFEAVEVDRLDEDTYKIVRAELTVCRPDRPTWKFYAAHAVLHVNQKVAMVNANFRLLRIPLIWLPYATAPAASKMRQSGFLIPSIGQSSIKGFVLGDSYYWAPKDWLDATIGGQYMSLRGGSQTAEIRAMPWENVNLTANYFGVIDRGLPGPNGVLMPEGGHTVTVKFDALLAHGWRAVADVNELSSLTFRLAFAETFGEAVNAEANSAAFLTNNFKGFSLNFALIDDRDFLNAQPQTTVTIRSAPEVRFSSVDQAPWKRLPFYFGFDSSAGAESRGDPDITTAAFVQRDEIAPRVTLPLHWGPWLGVTTTYAVDLARYSAELQGGLAIDEPVARTASELTVDIRPPALTRVWQTHNAKWKHSIEPDILYRDVAGINDFGRFIRFDQDDTLTDTNEFEYGITNRLFRKRADGTTQELLTWRIAQKYYFDPTFGGALVPGQRNVFEALDDITPFPFADTPRRMSPIVSDLTINPSGSYDIEFRDDYDTQRHKLTAAGTLVKLHPYRNKFNLTIADFELRNDPILQPLSNQLRTLFGYGNLNSPGWSFNGGVSYDFVQGVTQNEIAQVSYNGSCCGITFEYRRLDLGLVRTENQFRLSLVIANIGTFGTVRRQEKIY